MKNHYQERKAAWETNSRVYKIMTTINPDPYYEGEGYSFHKNIYQFKYREYRTWKYNRKTQYKIKLQ